MKSSLTFCGGAGSVTGVNIHLATGDAKVLLDCGLLQREAPDDAVNSSAFEYDVTAVDALFVSHAHADHIGRIPKLVSDGFRGVIYSTEATRDLAALMFDDALRVTKASLYDREDVAATLALWKTHGYHEPFPVKDFSCQFLDAGHILGSAMVQLTRNGRIFLYTGDLGNSPEPLLPDTESPQGARIMVMESVYGDRVHVDQATRREHLREIIEQVRERKGTLIIPAFSIERIQILLHEINDLLEARKIGHIPVFLDSPLAIHTTEIFRRHATLFNDEIRGHLERGDDPFSFPGLTLTRHTGDSMELHTLQGPKIILAGSGMSVGGRIRSHEKFYAPRHDATILFVGYQVPGSLGRKLLDGARRVEIDGEDVDIRAQVLSLSGFSGHKDRDGLIDFVGQTEESLEQVFVALGEPKSSLFLAQRLRDFLGVDAIVPEAKKAYQIDW